MALQIADSFTGIGIRHDLGSNDNLYVSSGIRSISSDSFAITGVGSLHSIQIDGIVFGKNAGIFMDVGEASSGNNSVAIGKTGQLGSESSAISFSGAGNLLINHGEINTMFGSAVVFGNGGAGGPPSKVINYGSISADSGGVNSFGPAIVVRNYGDITASFGSAVSASIGDDIVQNFGTLDGAVSTYGGADRLINRGIIVGDVYAGLDDDLVDNRFGTILGDVALGDGADTFKPGQSEETVDGETGRDTLDFSSSSGVQFALDGSVAATGWAAGDTFLGFENLTGSRTGADVLVGNSLVNTLVGNGGNDVLSGMAGDDTLDGGHGNDTLDGGAGIDDISAGYGDDIALGGAGNDTLRGDQGNDTLTGGIGKDGAYGGAGADRFVFANGDFGGKTSTTADTIFDFKQAETDRIDLRLVDAKSAVAGDQAFVFIGTAGFHNVAGELRYAQSGGSTYVQGDTNGDGVADFWIALSGLITLKAADFIL